MASIGWPTRTRASTAVAGCTEGASTAPRAISTSPCHTPKTTVASFSSVSAFATMSLICCARGSSPVTTPVAGVVAAEVAVEGAAPSVVLVQPATVAPRTSPTISTRLGLVIWRT
jgi:hypothetical protein